MSNCETLVVMQPLIKRVVRNRRYIQGELQLLERVEQRGSVRTTTHRRSRALVCGWAAWMCLVKPR